MTHYAIVTAPMRERAVRMALKRAGTDVYMPAKVTKTRRRTGRQTRVVLPMIPRYLFVKAPEHPAAVSLWMHQVKSTRHVVRFVSVTGDGIASPIADWKLDKLRESVTIENATERARKANAKVGLGKKARIKSGTGIGRVGEVTYLRGDWARLKAWLFGAEREIKVRAKDLEAA